MRTAIAFVIIAFWSGGTASAQMPPPDEVARCRSMDSVAQWVCFKALNDKITRAAKSNSAAPSLNPAALSAPSGMVAAEAAPVCASLSNPQKRLSCYDAKFPPSPMPAPVSVPPINN
jgi:hypothetical protein